MWSRRARSSVSPALCGTGPAERRRGAAAHGDRHGVLVRPAQGDRHLGRVTGQEDQVGNGARKATREQAVEVHVLIAVGLVAQELVGDDALVDVAARRGGTPAAAATRSRSETASSSVRARRATLLEADAAVQEGVQVRMSALGGRQRRMGAGLPD